MNNKSNGKSRVVSPRCCDRAIAACPPLSAAREAGARSDNVMTTKVGSSRRSFLRNSVAAGLGVSLLRSLEERALLAQASPDVRASSSPPLNSAVPSGTICKVKISRLICGGNLISGYAHSRDLLYVSPLLKHYFTDEKILETWSLCERRGVNTMLLNPANERDLALYQRHRAGGGKIQLLAQIGPEKDNLSPPIKRAKEAGAVGAYLNGNYGDRWTREGDVKRIGDLLQIVKDHGMIAGVAAHELRSIQAVEKAGLAPDFYMKTLHSTNYWSSRRPEQIAEVVDNYSTDNYWCIEPQKTISFMSELERPWIAYKVLAAGAIHPKAGFTYALQNGADFLAVGMFDFQIDEDAALFTDAFQAAQNRERQWFG